MSTKKQAVNVGSVPSSTGTGAGSASTIVTSPVTIVTPTSSTNGTSGAPVVAPKGFRLRLQQMTAGWQAVIPTGSGVPYQGTTLSQATVLSQLQGFLANYSALDSTTLAEKTARATVTQAEPSAQALLAEIKVALAAFFGPSSPQLTQFGLKPRAKPKPLSAEKQAMRVAKAQATRDIRGTKGKLQKAPLVSGPMQVTVTPVASPVASPTGQSTAGPQPNPADAPASPPATGK